MARLADEGDRVILRARPQLVHVVYRSEDEETAGRTYCRHAVITDRPSSDRIVDDASRPVDCFWCLVRRRP